MRRLGLEPSVDTLGRWMAHRIAELIERGNANERDRTEATELILKCWERRRLWTSGWPPEGLDRVFNWVERDLRMQSSYGSSDDPWTRRLIQVRRSLDQELRLWAQLAAAEEGLTVSDTEGDDLVDGELDDAEQRAARLVERLLSTATSTFRDLGDDATTEERAQIVRAKVAELQAGREALFSDLVQPAGAPADSTTPGRVPRRSPDMTKGPRKAKASTKAKAKPSDAASSKGQARAQARPKKR